MNYTRMIIINIALLTLSRFTNYIINITYQKQYITTEMFKFMIKPIKICDRLLHSTFILTILTIVLDILKLYDIL